MSIYRPGDKVLTLPANLGLSVISPRGAAPAAGLLNNLVAYWPGNEVGGQAFDVHGPYDLNDGNTVTSNPGHVYALARQYTRANNEFHQRGGDDPGLSAGDTDFTLASWLRMDTNANSMFAGNKWVFGNQEYVAYYQSVANRFRFVVRSAGISYVAQADTFGVPALNTWYLVIGWHDSVANTVSIEVNNTGVDLLGGVGPPNDLAARFMIGGVGQHWDGRIGPTMFWKSVGGAGGALSAARRTALWNGGAGVPYADFT